MKPDRSDANTPAVTWLTLLLGQVGTNSQAWRLLVQHRHLSAFKRVFGGLGMLRVAP